MRIAAAVALWVLAGCASSVPPAERACARAREFLSGRLDLYQDAVDRVARDYQIEQWKSETGDPAASPEKQQALFAGLQDAAYRPEVLREARETLAAAPPECGQRSELERAVRLLEMSILEDPAVVAKERENQRVQDDLTRKSNAFRLQVEGEAEPISQALYGKKLASLADRRARETLFRAHGGARGRAWLEWGFRGLIESRNAEAKLAGFPTYYEYRFSRSGLDLVSYRRAVEMLRTGFAPKVRALFAKLGQRAGIASVAPWDLRYLREKYAGGTLTPLLAGASEKFPLELAASYYARLGHSIERYGFSMDLFPRPGKNTHAFAMGVWMPRVDASGKAVPPAPDIRLLANLRKPVTWSDVSTVIHEMGHAVHMAEVRQSLGIFRGVGSVETEAIAMAFERLSGEPAFVIPALASTSGGAMRVGRAAALNQRAMRWEQSISLLRQAFFSDFEWSLYHQAGADPRELWARLHESWWGIKVPPALADWDIDHFMTAPVYVQNYALGILIVEQIRSVVALDLGRGEGWRAIGDRIRREYLEPGLRYDYLELTRRLTGTALSPESAMRLLP